MAIAPPVRFHPDVETIDPDEETTVDGINETFDQILTKTAEDYQHAVRGVHAKAHGILKAKMVVRPHLSPNWDRDYSQRRGNTMSICGFRPMPATSCRM